MKMTRTFSMGLVLLSVGTFTDCTSTAPITHERPAEYPAPALAAEDVEFESDRDLAQFADYHEVFDINKKRSYYRRTTVHFSPNGSWLIFTFDGTISLWNLAGRKWTKKREFSQSGTIDLVEFADNGGLLVVRSESGIPSYPRSSSRVTVCSYYFNDITGQTALAREANAGGRHIASKASVHGGTRVDSFAGFDPYSYTRTDNPADNTAQSGAVYTMAFSPSGGGRPSSSAVSPDGFWVAVAFDNGQGIIMPNWAADQHVVVSGTPLLLSPGRESPPKGYKVICSVEVKKVSETTLGISIKNTDAGYPVDRMICNVASGDTSSRLFFGSIRPGHSVTRTVEVKPGYLKIEVTSKHRAVCIAPRVCFGPVELNINLDTRVAQAMFTAVVPGSTFARIAEGSAVRLKDVGVERVFAFPGSGLLALVCLPGQGDSYSASVRVQPLATLGEEVLRHPLLYLHDTRDLQWPCMILPFSSALERELAGRMECVALYHSRATNCIASCKKLLQDVPGCDVALYILSVEHLRRGDLAEGLRYASELQALDTKNTHVRRIVTSTQREITRLELARQATAAREREQEERKRRAENSINTTLGAFAIRHAKTILRFAHMTCFLEEAYCNNRGRSSTELVLRYCDVERNRAEMAFGFSVDSSGELLPLISKKDSSVVPAFLATEVLRYMASEFILSDDTGASKAKREVVRLAREAAQKGSVEDYLKAWLIYQWEIEGLGAEWR